MHSKIKTWVAQAWLEIQQEINDWQFKSKQAQFIVYPRLLVTEGDRATAPPVASEYAGDDTEATFTVLDTVLLSGAWATGTAVAYIEYEELDGQFKWAEYFNETDPTPASDIFRLKWWGRYDLQTEVTDLLEADYATFYIQSTGGSTTQTNSEDSDNKPIQFIPWPQWLAAYEGDPVSRGRPLYFTETPDGKIDFWPRLDEEYVLSFQYTSEPQELSAHGDTPTDLPSNYHDLIVWRAVMYWADFQERPSQFTRAERRYESIKNRMNKNQKPSFSFGPNVFNYY